MKNSVFFAGLMVLTVFLSACGGQATAATEESSAPAPVETDGIWSVQPYLDADGNETDEWCITSQGRVTGTYSNETVTDGMLEAQLWYDCHGIFSFSLWEDGERLVQSAVGHDPYSIHVQTPVYMSFGPEGWMYAESDKIIVEEYRKMAFAQAMCDAEEVTFWVTNQDEPEKTYRFTVDTSNFGSLYKAYVGDL